MSHGSVDAQVDERGMAHTHIRALSSVCQAPDLLWVSFAPVALLYLSLKLPQRDVRERPYSRDTLGEAHRWHSQTSAVAIW